VKIIPVTNFKEFVPKAACDPENCPESSPLMYAKENRPMKVKERRNRGLMQLSEILLEASRNFIFIFLLIKADIKNLRPLAHVQKELI
jgi:hypothetical protein